MKSNFGSLILELFLFVDSLNDGLYPVADLDNNASVRLQYISVPCQRYYEFPCNTKRNCGIRFQPAWSSGKRSIISLFRQVYYSFYSFNSIILFGTSICLSGSSDILTRIEHSLFHDEY